MSAKLASLSLALCAALVLVCTPAGAHGDGYQTYDCQARFGPACTDCINVTITFTHNRHLLASRKLQRGGRGRGGEGGPPAGAPTNRTITACTDCSGAANFELKERTEWTAANGGTPAGECRCGAGFGALYATAPTTREERAQFTCQDCSQLTDAAGNPTPGVALSQGCGVYPVYVDGAWTLSLTKPTTRLPRGVGRPPCYEGQCVPCPTPSAPDATLTQCVV